MPYILLMGIALIALAALAGHEGRRRKKERSGGYPYSRNKQSHSLQRGMK